MSRVRKNHLQEPCASGGGVPQRRPQPQPEPERVPAQDLAPQPALAPALAAGVSKSFAAGGFSSPRNCAALINCAADGFGITDKLCRLLLPSTRRYYRRRSSGNVYVALVCMVAFIIGLAGWVGACAFEAERFRAEVNWYDCYSEIQYAQRHPKGVARLQSIKLGLHFVRKPVLKRAVLLCEAARICLVARRMSEAEENYFEALRICLSLDNTAESVHAERLRAELGLAVICEMKQDYASAGKHYRAVMADCRSGLGDDVYRKRALTGLCSLCFYEEHYEECVKFAENAMKLSGDSEIVSDMTLRAPSLIKTVKSRLNQREKTEEFLLAVCALNRILAQNELHEIGERLMSTAMGVCRKNHVAPSLQAQVCISVAKTAILAERQRTGGGISASAGAYLNEARRSLAHMKPGDLDLEVARCYYLLQDTSSADSMLNDLLRSADAPTAIKQKVCSLLAEREAGKEQIELALRYLTLKKSLVFNDRNSTTDARVEVLGELCCLQSQAGKMADAHNTVLDIIKLYKFEECSQETRRLVFDVFDATGELALAREVVEASLNKTRLERGERFWLAAAFKLAMELQNTPHELARAVRLLHLCSNGADRLCGTRSDLSFEYRVELARCLVKQKNYEQALKEYEKIRQSDSLVKEPSRISSLADEGVCLRLMNRLTESGACLEEAYKRSLNLPARDNLVKFRCARKLSTLYLDQKNWTAAQAPVLTCVQLAPQTMLDDLERGQAYFYYAFTLNQRGDRAARKYFLSALDNFKKSKHKDAESFRKEVELYLRDTEDTR